MKLELKTLSIGTNNIIYMNRNISDQKLSLPINEKCSVCIIGLGYVGLPLAIQIAKTTKKFNGKQNLSRKVIGFDINEKRIKELEEGIDSTLEIEKKRN